MVFIGLGCGEGAVQGGQVRSGVVAARDGDFGELALDGERVLGGERAEVGQVQFNDGIADGGDMTLGYGHSGLQCGRLCLGLQVYGRL